MDAKDFDRHTSVITQADDALGGIDLALIAHGTLPDQRACEQSFKLTRVELETNCLSTISLLTYLANLLEPRGAGTLAVISSLAGDRGRQSSHVYGTAKDREHALQRNRNQVDLPGYWWLIMLVIRTIRESIFKRLSL